MKTTFTDWLWLLHALFRGKILRQKAYRPKGVFFHAGRGATVRRMTMLLRWYGLRLPTKEEYEAMVHVPYLDWAGKWDFGCDEKEWDCRYRIVLVRK